jgi:hypothetical protein
MKPPKSLSKSQAPLQKLGTFLKRKERVLHFMVRLKKVAHQG